LTFELENGRYFTGTGQESGGKKVKSGKSRVGLDKMSKI
jgi:hypothetical protein